MFLSYYIDRAQKISYEIPTSKQVEGKYFFMKNNSLSSTSHFKTFLLLAESLSDELKDRLKIIKQTGPQDQKGPLSSLLQNLGEPLDRIPVHLEAFEQSYTKKTGRFESIDNNIVQSAKELANKLFSQREEIQGARAVKLSAPAVSMGHDMQEFLDRLEAGLCSLEHTLLVYSNLVEIQRDSKWAISTENKLRTEPVFNNVIDIKKDSEAPKKLPRKRRFEVIDGGKPDFPLP